MTLFELTDVDTLAKH